MLPINHWFWGKKYLLFLYEWENKKLQSLGNLKRIVKVLLVKVSISFCLLPNAIAIGCNSNKLICQPFRTEFAFKHSPSFKLDWPFRCLVISCMFTSHVSHLRKPIKYYSADLVRKGGGGYPSCPQLAFFLEQVKKNIMFCLFWRFFSVVIFVDAPKKGGILYSLMYLWYILIFQYLIFSFTQTLRYWSAPFTPILSLLRPSDNEDRVQVWEKENVILILPRTYSGPMW